MHHHYAAPWGKPLILISTLATLLCGGMAIGFLLGDPPPLRWVAVLPLAIVGGSALFTIRGYTLKTHALYVQRLFWQTRLSLADLQSATLEPNVMAGSIRLVGNGGLFSFTGLFRNKTLGNYRALVTDLQQTVVLRFAQSTVVISPAMPASFVAELQAIQAITENP